MLVDFQYVFPFVVLVSFTWALASQGMCALDFECACE